MADPKKNIYSRLLQHSRPYAHRILLSMAASIIVAGTDVTYAKLVQPFIDRIISGGERSLVPMVPFIIIGLALTKGIARFVQEYFIQTAGHLVVQDLRNKLYRHSLSLSLSYHDRTTSGFTMSRILNDVGVLQRSAAEVLVQTLREGFTLIGLIALAFYNDWQLAIVAFLVLPIAVIPASIIGSRIKDRTRRSQALLGELTGVLQETLAGIKVIKAFGSEKAENRRFEKENLGFYRLMRKVLKYGSAAAPVMEVLSSFGVAAVLWFGIQRVLSGAMTQGELFSFLTAVIMMYGPVKRLARVNNTIQISVGAGERVFELLDIESEVNDPPVPVEPKEIKGEVRFENVFFAYDEEVVLKDFSVSAHPGEVVALVGPSGAGKSTVVGLLARFYDPKGGRILVDGQDIRHFSQQSLKGRLAFVDQDTFLFNDTIANNIRYGRPEATDEEVEAAARLAFADEFIRLLPEGYATTIGDRGVRLSGGQRQRLCIARALLRDAPILILDEATSALDTESESMVQKALANLMQNRTTFVIAHRLSTIMHADKIVVLEDGRVREVGTHSELLETEGLYKRLYDLQFEA